MPRIATDRVRQSKRHVDPGRAPKHRPVVPAPCSANGSVRLAARAATAPEGAVVADAADPAKDAVVPAVAFDGIALRGIGPLRVPYSVPRRGERSRRRKQFRGR